MSRSSDATARTGSILLAGRNLLEVGTNERERVIRIDIARECNRRIRRMVVARKERVDLVQPDGIQVRHLADGGPVVRMIGWEERGQDGHRAQTVRPVLVILPPLVEDHGALVRELGLGQRRQQIAHPVRFHPQAELERAGRDHFPVVRPIRVGRSVQRGARALQRLKVTMVVML